LNLITPVKNIVTHTFTLTKIINQLKIIIMKKLLLIAIIGLPLFSMGQNLAPNPDFETAGTGGTTTFANYSTTNAERDGLPANVIAGSASARFTNPTNASYLTSEDITVEEGKTYRVSFRGRIQAAAGPEGSAAATGGTRLLLTFQYWTGVPNANSYTPFNTTGRPTVTTSTNTTVSADYLIPVGSGRTRTRLVFDKNSGIAYADEVVVQDVTTLPITLSSFIGQSKEFGVGLNWTTTSEVNNQYFEVLRAGEDRNFTSIGKVNGVVNSSETKTYSFSDFNPLAGNNYYQLKQVDLDGKSESFGPVVVKFGLSEDSFNVLSTSETSVTISISSSEAKQAELTYIGLDGRTLYKQNISLASGLNTFNLPVDKSTGNIGIIAFRANGEQKSLKIAR
jgi:hypothetical protein